MASIVQTVSCLTVTSRRAAGRKRTEGTPSPQGLHQHQHQPQHADTAATRTSDSLVVGRASERPPRQRYNAGYLDWRGWGTLMRSGTERVTASTGGSTGRAVCDVPSFHTERERTDCPSPVLCRVFLRGGRLRAFGALAGGSCDVRPLFFSSRLPLPNAPQSPSRSHCRKKKKFKYPRTVAHNEEEKNEGLS